MNLNGRNILITGASSGIGKALANKLMNENCNLALISRRINILNEMIKTKQNDGAAIAVSCDVTDKHEVERAFDKVISEFGHVDIAILNSGIGIRMNVDEFNSEAAEKTFGVNVMGIIYWVEKLLPEFLKRKSGVVAGLSSMADNRGYSGSGFYCASKAAATIFLEGLRVELRPHGIKVITIKPGFVKTPMTDKNDFDMPFIMDAGKAAEIILKGIKKEKSVIQFPLPTVIGSKIIGALPGFIYEMFAKKLS
ncbi:MAG: SDR family NAD(P)-dependent oxidoreductase [Melioribacteraceae bacterium]|nr:SDR family NAD(P)-dependent oxidoreductase [Melioribacteraceae bacterium]MCF8355405.1 SDR family NAD(P)-dependent oxidoreductase [Melioribacteraceae bacterium]MCF8393247.1 SDR family NAD(P)-dependent oxidoreductase [Melioribacteraceae bacterium]MCF8417548.1 SDR family NAD(P)-dependent oxidoreductase [Melioribacteraceae bacterium]